jgi:Regulator of G protein signaling domain
MSATPDAAAGGSGGAPRGRTRRKILRLKDIFADEVLMELFTDHLEATLCAENLLFFQEAELYQKCVSDEQRRELYNSIVKKFLLPESEYTMDCPDHIAAAILVAPDPPPLDVFDEMMIEAYGVLSRDSLQRFLASPQYKAFLENPPDSPRTRRMRRKAERIFGESILGPLMREELVRVSKGRTKFHVRRTADGRIVSITHFGWAKSIKQKKESEKLPRSSSVDDLKKRNNVQDVRNPTRRTKITVEDRQRVSSEPDLDNWDLCTASETSPSPERSPRSKKESKKAEKAAKKAAKKRGTGTGKPRNGALPGKRRNQRAATTQAIGSPAGGSPSFGGAPSGGSGMFGGVPSGASMFGGAPAGSGATHSMYTSSPPIPPSTTK